MVDHTDVIHDPLKGVSSSVHTDEQQLLSLFSSRCSLFVSTTAKLHSEYLSFSTSKVEG